MVFQLKPSKVDIRDAFFEEAFKIASEDPNFIFLTGDMGAFSLEKFKKELPTRCLNIGISEQNMISVAAGLALGGKVVFAYSIIPFVTMRCYEQIKVDICSMNLPVTIVGIGAGFTYSGDGLTHHAIQDIAIMRALPEITIYNVTDAVMTQYLSKLAYKSAGPKYIRIEKGILPLIYEGQSDFSSGIAELKKGKDLTIVTTGYMVHKVYKVIEELAEHSIDAGIVDLYRIKPVNDNLLLKIINNSKKIVTIEENTLIGGIGSIVSEILTDKMMGVPLKRISLPDTHSFQYGDRGWLHSIYGIDVDNITKVILKWI